MEAGLVDVSVDGVKESTVSLKGCTFAWDDNTNVLKDITLELAPRELHMVVGSVASVKLLLHFRLPTILINMSQEKSSLLMSILEETRLVEGKVKVKAHKASSVHTVCVSDHLHIVLHPGRACEPNSVHLPRNSTRQLGRPVSFAAHT
jgi:hypothetical protein